jgi:hypothetical protein
MANIEERETEVADLARVGRIARHHGALMAWLVESGAATLTCQGCGEGS